MKINQCIKYEDWKDIYNWDTCTTNREEYGKFLLSYLTSKNGKFVLNLNGVWGTGKTEFLKRLYVNLAEDSYPVIYIDAWESDFLDNPLNVICTEILTQLGWMFSNNNKTKYNKIKKSVESLINGFNEIAVIVNTAVSAYNLSTQSNIDFSEIDNMNSIFRIVNKKNMFTNYNGVADNNEILLSQLIKNQDCIIKSMKEIRRQISAIGEIMHHTYGLNTPIVFLIDELDRCRPTYAIKMLEIIKHFFESNGCVFLVATDTVALTSSIKTIYGNDFEADKYLNRFFNQRIRLEKPSIKQYLASKDLTSVREQHDDIAIIPKYKNDDDLLDVFTSLLERESLELRDIEQILSKLDACIYHIVNNKIKNSKVINVVVLLYGIIENHLNSQHFYNRTNTQTSGILNGKSIKKCEFMAFISNHLRTVTLKSSTTEYVNSGRYRDNGRPSMRLEITTINYFDLTAKAQMTPDDTFQIVEMVRIYRTAPEDYLLWEDYKKLISLSSAIS